MNDLSIFRDIARRNNSQLAIRQFTIDKHRKVVIAGTRPNKTAMIMLITGTQIIVTCMISLRCFIAFSTYLFILFGTRGFRC
jgi:hypothetical protein